MNCEKAKSWLLTQHADRALPLSVGRHVLACSSCQKLERNLAVLDKHAAKLMHPPADPKAKQRFLATFADTPQEAPLTTAEHPVAPASAPPPLPWPTSSRWRRWGRLGAGMAAVLMLFALGWAGGRFTAPAPVEPLEADDPSPIALTTALLELNVELVKATTPAERLEPLRRMADVLWEHFAQRVESGAGDDVLSLTSLQEHVWKYGLVDGVRQLPKEAQPDAVASVVKQLQRMRGEAEEVLPLLSPAMAECVQRLLLTWQEVEPELRLNRAPMAMLPQLPLGGAQSLPTQLVACSLRLGREGDPLQRAELCATLAKQVAQHAAIWSSQPTRKSLQPLAAHWEAFVKQGIHANLERTPAPMQTPAQKAKMEQIRATTKSALSQLENHAKQWLGGPPPGWPRGPETQGKGGEKGPPPGGWNKDDRRDDDRRDDDRFGKGKGKGKFPFPFTPNKKFSQGADKQAASAFSSYINRAFHEGAEKAWQHRRPERRRDPND